MFNFRFNITDYLNEIPSNILVIGIFFLVVVLLGLLAIYIVSSFGIMIAAKKNNIPSPWIAFIPYGRYYIIGKLGFEVYPEKDKKHPELTWILFGLSVASLFWGNVYVYGGIFSIAITIFNAMAFYNIFKAIAPKNSTIFTVFTVLVENLGGIFLYALRNKIETIEVKEVQETNSFQEEKKEPKKEKTEKVNPSFCSNCGTKLTKTAKFCPECGHEIK